MYCQKSISCCKITNSQEKFTLYYKVKYLFSTCFINKFDVVFFFKLVFLTSSRKDNVIVLYQFLNILSVFYQKIRVRALPTIGFGEVFLNDFIFVIFFIKKDYNEKTLFCNFKKFISKIVLF